jgi:hypothetical protein
MPTNNGTTMLNLSGAQHTGALRYEYRRHSNGETQESRREVGTRFIEDDPRQLRSWRDEQGGRHLGTAPALRITGNSRDVPLALLQPSRCERGVSRRISRPRFRLPRKPGATSAGFVP